ncbi:ATP synthase subunit delta, sodium ion specific [Symmachiella macrocystis]|uniref:ATP synthase subunit delta n=1 Tax=Symmachiella macrocystis TaxID=2527985 RepID=A0A5C6B916_9PLAN|nr:ATP synthase F1 subunit delta [Symmachiella macrocystis]TWU07014.1 ATP synthase subunit delta, sodium ion specific [Symmachiella macrocystis]
MNDATSKIRVASVLEDPSARAIAKVYSGAFLGAIGDGDAAGHLEELVSFIEDVVDAHPNFATILLSQMVSKDDKVSILERVLPGHGSDILLNFLRVLATHDRLDLLPLIAQEAQLQFETTNGQGRVQITSAKPLSDAQLQNITQSLKTKLSFDPIIEPQVDPTVLGGLVIQIGNIIHDGSIKTQLKSLRGRLQQRSLHEIQSGRDRFSTPEGN